MNFFQKSASYHKKTKTETINKLLDMKLTQMKKKQQIFHSESSIKTEPLLLSTQESEYVPSCKNCYMYLHQTQEQKEQIKELKKEVDILKIEKEILKKKEEDSIKQLSTEIQKIQLQQKRQSTQMQKQMENFLFDHKIQKNLQQVVSQKDLEIVTLKEKLSELQKCYQDNANLLNRQYEFQVNMNIKFANLRQSTYQLSQLTQRYVKLNECIAMQSTPQLDLLLPNSQDQLTFHDINDMTNKLQEIQLGYMIQQQQQIDDLIKLMQENVSRIQKTMIQDITRLI